MRAHGIFKKRPQLFPCRRRIARLTRFACCRRNRGVPPGPRARRAPPLRDVQQYSMSRGKGKHSLQNRHRLRDAAKKQISSDGILRQVFGHCAGREQRSNLRSKRKTFRRLRVIERLDAQRVARQEENRCRGITLAKIKQSEGEHAPQFGEGVFAPLFPSMNENFRVRLGGQAVTAERQALAQVAIVVQLTVENDRDVLGFVPGGLVAASQIDDAQPAHPQCESRRPRIAGKKAFFIRTAMFHRRGHRSHARFGICVARSEGDAADAAHATL